MPRPYDAEFRRRVVELVRAGKPVRMVAEELDLARRQHRWKAEDLVDRGIKPGLATSERGELAAAKTTHPGVGDRAGLVKQAAALLEEGCAQEPNTRPSLS